MWYHNLFSQILTTSSRHWLLNWIFRTFCIASLTISMNKICILPMFTYSFTNSTWCLIDTDIYISLRRCPCFHGTKANTFLTIAIVYFQGKKILAIALHVSCKHMTSRVQTPEYRILQRHGSLQLIKSSFSFLFRDCKVLFFNPNPV